MINYLHLKKNDLNKTYLITMIPLIIYGLYKNIILVYGQIGSFNYEIIKPLLLLLISILVPIGFNLLKRRKVTIDENLVYSLFLLLTIPISTNILVFFLLQILNIMLIEYIDDKISLNYVVISRLLLVLISVLISKINYANQIEILNIYSYNLIDVLFGRGITAIFCSSIIISLIGYIVLSFNPYYKKEIPFIILCIYLVGSLLLKLVFSKVIIINGLIIFSIIFLSNINLWTPVNKTDKYIYSVIVGVLSLLFTYFVNFNEGVLIAIFITSILFYLKSNFLSNDTY